MNHIKNIFVPIFFFGIFFSASAQDEADFDYTQEKETNQVEINLLQRANELYAQGEFLLAAHLYEQILLEKGVAPELFFNLGNAYFRAHEIARAILNYERALRLNPRFVDARYNLELAQARVLDNIIAPEPFFLKRLINKLISDFTSNQWFYFSWILFIVSLICFLLFVFGRSRTLRKISFGLAVAILAISMSSLTISVVRKNQFLNHQEAIVMIGVITVKSSPDRSGTHLFELREGTKVRVVNTLGDWVEIMIADGRIGWVERRQVEKI